ncbi:MAG: TniQ family protein [Colwellia sp.]|nr:TniQ family protein [Colwellia sp.]
MLLIRPYPNATDSLPSYLLRLTAANGYKNSMQLLRTANCKLLNNRLPSKKVFFGEFDLERVAMLANINTSQVEALKFKHINNTRCLAFGQQHLVKSLNITWLRVCPHCYEESKAITFINSLASKTYCTKHNYLLITVHPVTGRKLTWATHYLWRDVASWGDNASSVEIGEAEFKINQKIEYLENNRIIIGRQQLNLAEYCDLLEFFAHFHQFSFCSQQKSSAKSDIEFCRQYYSAAYWYIAEWPTRFFELLSHFEDHPMSDKRLTGIRKCFRDLYDDIYSPENCRSGAYKLLKSAFEEYLRDYFSTGMLMSSLTQIDNNVREKSTYISETQVAELLCCHLGKVKVYVREKLLSYSHVLPNGTHLFLRSDVIKLKSRLMLCGSIDESTELLGISVYHTRLLLRDNIIPPLLKPNNENRDWLIERSQIKKLVKQLKSSADPTIKNSETSQKRYAFIKVNFGRLIQSMLNGDINFGYIPNKNQPLSLEQFSPCFDANDEPLTDFLSPTEAKIELGVNINAIYDFIKSGYLECEKKQVKRTARPVKMIPKASIDKFKSQYLLTKQAKKSKGFNIKLISGPKIDGCCVNLYTSTD